MSSSLEVEGEGSPAAVEQTATASRLKRHDSLFGDAEKVTGGKHHGSAVSWAITLHLAFQSVGVIYGDIGTSPLYVYSSTFPDGVGSSGDLVGALSLILYTLIIIPMLKYVFIVLYANDNGDGGTFALYSLISRYAKIRMIPNQQAEDAMVSNYSIEAPNSQLRRAQWVKHKLESSRAAKMALFFLTILGTSMVMGDGTLTPAISVLSAVGGIREKAPNLTQTQVVMISVAILFMLFSVQRFGTDKVGYSFAPIISVWFLLIAGIGLYNLVVHDITILKAFNPWYIVQYFRRNGKKGWVSLGGIVLCVTGTEGMFADLGHFNIRAVQISFNCILFPSVALCYIGQAAYLTKFPENVSDTFYKSIPGPLFWPTFIVAILAAIIASQAMLSGAFAILSKALSLGCMPRVRVIHTSKKYEGQVYIPEVNFMMGLASIIVTIAFRTTTNIGNAYGICVVMTFMVTTHLMTVVMLLIWKKHLVFILLFYCVFGFTEALYLSSILSKFVQGGYLPFCFAMVLMTMMATWHYVHVKRYWYELDHIVPTGEMTSLLEKNGVRRVPGVGLLYTELVQGIPPLFPRLVRKIPSVHAVFVFMSIKHLPIPHVAPPERFLFRQVGPREHRMFRCVARYGYSDALEQPKEFAAFLVDGLKMFIQEESAFALADAAPPALPENNAADDEPARPRRSTSSAVHSEEAIQATSSGRTTSVQLQAGGEPAVMDVEEEKRLIDREVGRGVVYLMGEANVSAGPKSSILKRIAVNYIYTFLRKNLTEGHRALAIPKDQLLKVGITYEI
ncbi:potassium transporter 1 [Oryza glaberrima]|uniref:Potassium transporter n=1 Tax=Oryza glaberrima TaxID=4538 RepID=I1P679_ORYGL|nr:potassium transporter 1 [Oryza glaberrima]XP_052153291.1 potassium transporter 1 [Oryza glaberrima]